MAKLKRVATTSADETPAKSAETEGFVNTPEKWTEQTALTGAELLRQAQDAGLKVTAQGSELLIKGPARAQPVAQMLLRHKDAVLAALCEFRPAEGVDVTETPKPSRKRGVSSAGGVPFCPGGAETGAVSHPVSRTRAAAEQAWESARRQLASDWAELARASKKAGVEPPVLDPQVDLALQADVQAAILAAESPEGLLHARSAIRRWVETWRGIEVPDALVKAARCPPLPKPKRKGRTRPAPKPPSWSPAAERAIAWFQTQPGTLPTTSFDFYPWARVTNPEVFFRSLKADIEAGPSGVRARTGVLQADLLRLAEICGADIRKGELETKEPMKPSEPQGGNGE